MTNSLQDIAETFADKARINANFALAAIRGGGPSKEDLPSRIVAYQPANQLIVEGLELLLKAMLLKQGTKPSLEHRLSVLYAELPASDKTVVGTVVHEAIAESSTGALPFELPNEAGVMLNSSLLDYRMPTALDVPMIETIIVEVPNANHPFGVRGIGETGIVPPAPAVANAIADATGVRLYQTPMNPGRVLEALARKNRA